MTHYVCTGGCGGVVEEPGVCNTETCPLHKHELKACSCEDGQHAEVKAQAQVDQVN